jgi:dipeptidyl aminopeptidase/acylaminoacyl peptidase
MSTDPGRRAGTPRDPYGLRPRQAPLGPLLAFGGLVLVAVLTMSAITGQLPTVPTGGGGDGGVSGGATPAPSNVVVVPKDPRAEVPGTIAYAKQGSIWIQSGTTATQLTTGGDDSMPAFTADGRWIYFIRTVDDVGLWPAQGRNSYYTLTYPVLMRVAPTGGKPETVVSGRYKKGNLSWFSWLRQPTPNPSNPEQLAVVSDQPDPTKGDVVLQLLDVSAEKPVFTVAEGTKETPPLGHQDPAWYPTGNALLYVRNARDGRRAAPTIWRYDPVRKRTSQMTGPGYLSPSFSPDGRFVAATKTSSFGTDVVVLDAKTGGEVLRVTDDGGSFSPAWSPQGDAIAFLHVVGQVVDLRETTLTTNGAVPALGETIDLTQVSGLDATSRPSWYIPASELPTPAPSPSASGSGSAAPSS